MHAWICDHIIARSREEYNRVGDREYLLECFRKGELRTSVAFSVYTKDGDLQSCREVFFLYQETTTLDVCAFCVVYDLTEQQKEAQERELLERELQMSRLRNFTSQMQPHFLYNTLGSIQEVILTDPEYASELLESFTLHLRSCIRAMTKDEPQPFLQELENIKAYVNIEKMRFGDKLRLHYEIECTDFMILPLTIQPLVENAVRHGIYGRGPAGGDVYIRSREEKTEWIVQIEDTGVGFDVEEYRRQQGSGKGDSTGIRNIRFRLEKIMGASLELQSRKGKGTTAVVHIPKEGI